MAEPALRRCPATGSYTHDFNSKDSSSLTPRWGVIPAFGCLYIGVLAAVSVCDPCVSRSSWRVFPDGHTSAFVTAAADDQICPAVCGGNDIEQHAHLPIDYFFEFSTLRVIQSQIGGYLDCKNREFTPLAPNFGWLSSSAVVRPVVLMARCASRYKLLVQCDKRVEILRFS